MASQTMTLHLNLRPIKLILKSLSSLVLVIGNGWRKPGLSWQIYLPAQAQTISSPWICTILNTKASSTSLLTTFMVDLC